MKTGSFDIIGNIAILPLYSKHSKKTAAQIMKENKNIKSVYVKSGKIYGRLRKRKLKFIAGIKTKKTIHKESGCFMKMDVEECYFSPRLSNDRLMIARKVKNGERVLIMFSGIAPYALVVSKHSKAEKVYAVEINKKASKYAEENVSLNKLKNVEIIQGDVKKIIPKLKMKFDRIIMARPQLKDTFLDSAFKASKKGTIIHYHDFLLEEDIDKKANNIVEEAIKLKRKIKILSVKKIGEIAPRKNRVRIDFIVL